MTGPVFSFLRFFLLLALLEEVDLTALDLAVHGGQLADHGRDDSMVSATADLSPSPLMR